MLIDVIRQAGVVGAGGAGFPTHVKLNTKAECFIVNAAECEPLIETDKFFCRVFTEELVDATVVVAEHLKAKRTVIALKEHYTKEVEALKQCIKKKSAPIELFLMDSFYPAGDEQVLVHQVTGRSVPERGIPIAVGAVVDNVGTVLNIYNALNNVNVTEKYLSVTGAVEKPVMMKVPIGTPVIECIKAAKPTIDEYNVILGGPMMGKQGGTDEEIAGKAVTKTTSNLIVLPRDHYLVQRDNRPMRYNLHLAQTACLQCRFCTMQCPRYKIGHDIQPHKIMRAIFMEKNIVDNETYEKYYGGAMNCSECGVCEMYACPMGLSPRKVNIYLKGQLREKKIDVPKNANPETRDIELSGKVETERLIIRLGLWEYSQKHANDDVMELFPYKVAIPMSQHIGKPAQPCVKAGDKVSQGDLIGFIPDNALAATIHASVNGTVEEVNDQEVIIRRD